MNLLDFNFLVYKLINNKNERRLYMSRKSKVRKIVIFIVFLLFVNFNLQSERYDYLKNFKPGSYVVYKVYDDEGNQVVYKVSILKKVKNDEYWVEYNINSNGEKNIIKMLISFKDGIKRFIMKSGDGPAKELPYSMVKMMGGDNFLDAFNNYMYDTYKAVNYEDKNIKVITKKNVRVKTPAGKFKCKYIKSIVKNENRVDEIYVNDEVPGGIVKIVENKKLRVLLIKYKKKGAKSDIKGKIEKINIPAGMPFSQ